MPCTSNKFHGVFLSPLYGSIGRCACCVCMHEPLACMYVYPPVWCMVNAALQCTAAAATTVVCAAAQRYDISNTETLLLQHRTHHLLVANERSYKTE